MTTGEAGRAPVMADVARLAGVSHQTVSRVINAHPSVSNETRSKVERAIVQLGYRRNTAARALVTRRTGLLGVITTDTQNFGPASMLVAIEEAARENGYFVSFVSVKQLSRTHMRAAFDHLLSAGVDGIVIIAPIRTAEDAVEGLASSVPLVVVEGTGTSGVSSVMIDQVQGSRLVTKLLLDLGHATVHHVRGPRTWLEAEDRVEGWRAELSAHGRVTPECLMGDWSARSGYECGQILARDPQVTAIFAANDQMALGVLLALHEAGRRVPEDVSVAGFDDLPEAAYFLPPLTTVRQEFAEVGRRCLEQLRTLMTEHSVALQTVIRPQLIVRGSTGPAPRH